MAITVVQFVENLIYGGLFTADELAVLQQSLPPDHQTEKPQDLARELIQATPAHQCKIITDDP